MTGDMDARARVKRLETENARLKETLASISTRLFAQFVSANNGPADKVLSECHEMAHNAILVTPPPADEWEHEKCECVGAYGAEDDLYKIALVLSERGLSHCTSEKELGEHLDWIHGRAESHRKLLSKIQPVIHELEARAGYKPAWSDRIEKEINEENAVATPPPEGEPKSSGIDNLLDEMAADIDSMSDEEIRAESSQGEAEEVRRVIESATAHPTPEQTSMSAACGSCGRIQHLTCPASWRFVRIYCLDCNTQTEVPVPTAPEQTGDALAAFERLCNWYDVPGDNDDVRAPGAAEKDVETVRQALNAARQGQVGNALDQVPDSAVDEAVKAYTDFIGSKPDWSAMMIALQSARSHLSAGGVPEEVRRLPEIWKRDVKSYALGHHSFDRAKQNCAEDLERALASAPADGWQPIETAPKDGNHIQLWRPDIQFVGYYAKAGWCANGPVLLDPPPTHWKPLAAAPTDGRG